MDAIACPEKIFLLHRENLIKSIHSALATRLALSELYLKGMDGFFLLDDPFTDMDSSRRAAAVQAIGSFAENHQVLFFTCHPEHAGELQSLAGAKSLQLTE